MTRNNIQIRVYEEVCMETESHLNHNSSGILPMESDVFLN